MWGAGEYAYVQPARIDVLLLEDPVQQVHVQRMDAWPGIAEVLFVEGLFADFPTAFEQGVVIHGGPRVFVALADGERSLVRPPLMPRRARDRYQVRTL